MQTPFTLEVNLPAHIPFFPASPSFIALFPLCPFLISPHPLYIYIPRGLLVIISNIHNYIFKFLNFIHFWEGYYTISYAFLDGIKSCIEL